MPSEAEMKRRAEQKQSNQRELKNEFRIIKDDLNRLTYYTDEFIESGTANDRYSFNLLLKRITNFKKQVQKFKRWFPFWKPKDWHERYEEDE